MLTARHVVAYGVLLQSHHDTRRQHVPQGVLQRDGRPLEPDDERYVSLYDAALTDSDPVQQLARVIEWSAESVRLFSGYRGAGKSTDSGD